MAVSGAYDFSPARMAAAGAAAELVEQGMTIGLGSGRAVWAVIEAIGARFGPTKPVQVVVASEATYALVHAAGLEVIQLNGEIELDLAIDGADEIAPGLALLKGGGGALLREKIVASAAKRFVVVAENTKLVDHLGQTFRLPVETVRFGWRDTRRRFEHLLPEAERRAVGDEPYMTDEGHFILDSTLPAGSDPRAIASGLEQVPGVVEHGLFIDMAERALVGKPDGTVDELLSSG